MSRRSFNSVRSYFFRAQCARVDREAELFGGRALERYDLDDFRAFWSIAASQAVDAIQASLNKYNHAAQSWDRPVNQNYKDLLR